MSLNAFLDYLLLEKKYSKLTIHAYQKDIVEFSGFIGLEYGNSSIDTVNYSQIRSWIVSLVEKGISNRSINRKVSALNSYYKFLLKTESIQINPLAKHKALKTSKKIQVPFSETEIATVLDDINYDNDFEGVRNKLIIELFYSTGIRRMELIELKLKDIDFSNKTLKVLGKRNKERYVPLLNMVMKSLNVYLGFRNQLENITDKEVLFLTKNGV
ncbi:MAG TPA: integrase, partial [Xanthomarina gelatinilytica]|nr:integrase [Xanthomarina gelatinilytica]